MNGAESLLKALIGAGVEVCFANPGTSEMQLVAAIDNIAGMRPILCLFEGVATGAADGYGRMADKPAATLLHLGSGLANGMANLHNAKRAFTPIVNIIGEHATYHLPLDAPLTSDIPALAGLASDWVRVSQSTQALAQDGLDAVHAASAGRSATLIVPANFAWSEGGAEVMDTAADYLPTRVADSQIERIANVLLKGETSCLLLGGMALRERGLQAAARIAAVTGARLISEVFPARIQRGRTRPTIERLPYLGEFAAATLKDLKQLVLVGAKAPVSFFAYPHKPSTLWPEACKINALAVQGQDQIAALEALADYLGAAREPALVKLPLPDIPEGAMTAEAVGAVIAKLLPEHAIVSDESNTAGAFSYGYYDSAAPHDWLTLTGGAIGQGLPLAVGAAIACPDRKVINLQADGSAMYTNQALWSMAREQLDVCVVIYNNSSYAILNLELMRVGVENPGPRARSMLNLSNPVLDWLQIAGGMGIAASRATTTAQFYTQFEQAMVTKGPCLIEVIL
jgi:acetolactate synthase-1/2/3 large subunit